MINILIFIGFLIPAAMSSWYGHVFFAAFFSLLSSAFLLRNGGRTRIISIVLCITLPCLAVHRSNAWDLKKRRLVVTAEQLLLKQIAAGQKTSDLSSQADEWKRFAKTDPAYQVVVNQDSDSKAINYFLISVGYLHNWKVMQDFDLNDEPLPSVRWVAVGDDAEIVQKELDLFIAEQQ